MRDHLVSQRAVVRLDGRGRHRTPSVTNYSAPMKTFWNSHEHAAIGLAVATCGRSSMESVRQNGFGSNFWGN